jgi:hypothetical protein
MTHGFGALWIADQAGQSGFRGGARYWSRALLFLFKKGVQAILARFR